MVEWSKLEAYYGEQSQWWPAETPFHVMVGAILTQNTNWHNVEKVFCAMSGNITPEFIEHSELSALIEIIKPAGFFNQKSRYLKNITAWYANYHYSESAVKATDLKKLRKELLAVKGCGPETVDTILLYGFGFPSFVVDAYTKRLLKRMGYISDKASYDQIQNLLVEYIEVDVSLYKNIHALIVRHSQVHCKKTPVCMGCVFEGRCMI